MDENLVFKQAETGRAAEDIALQIEAAIINRQLLPGDKLPSERDLQVQFGTGRGVVREAIMTLKQKDLIEVKKGSRGGAFVKEAEVTKLSESLSLFLKQKDISPEMLIEFRESIDETITILAVSRSVKEEKKALYEKALEFKKTTSHEEPDIDQIGETDRQLNIMLARMARNPLFEWIMRAVQLGFSSYDYALYEKEYYRKLTIDNWTNTTREIKEGEPMKALSYIGYHYSLLRKCIEEKNGRFFEREVIDKQAE